MTRCAVYKDFSGGLNTLVGPLIIDDGKGSGLFYADDAQNFQMTPSGLLKFPGFTSILNSALPGPIDGIFGFRVSGTWNIVACSAGKIYTISAGTATQIFTGNTGGYGYQAIATNGILLLLNGKDVPVVWTGSGSATQMTVTDPTSIWDDFRPQGCTEFRNRLWFWGDSTRPDQLLTPSPGTYNDFDNSQGTVDGLLIAPGMGGAITGVKALRDDYLVIYKEYATRRLAGSTPFGGADPFQVYHISDELGCASPGCVSQVGFDHYFLSQSGLKKLSQVLSTDNIDAADPTFIIQDAVQLWGFGTSLMPKSVMAFDQINNRLVLNVPGSAASTANDITFDYNVATNTNEPRGGGFNASAIAYINGQVYHGDYSGNIYLHGGINSYNGAVMPAFWRSKYVAHSGIGALKAYRRLVIYAEAAGYPDLSADIVVQWNVVRRGVPFSYTKTETDASGGGQWDVSQWDQAVWAAGNGSVFEIKNLGKGKAIQLQLTNNSASQLPKIREIDLYYDVFGNSRG